MNKLERQIDRCRKAFSFSASRAKPGMSLVHDKKSGKNFYSNSPKATGTAGNFKMGKTKSGKEISSYSHKSATHSWSSQDHLDAYRAHGQHVAHLDPDDTHPKLIAHHQAAMEHHYKAAFPNFKKSFGEFLLKAHPHGVLGKTRSGKKIYHHHHHHSHAKFSKDDHADAAHLHHRRSMKIMKRMSGSKGKMRNALGRLLDKHSMGVHHHGHAHHGK